MSRLLSGLEEAEKTPYKGWKTFTQNYSPENDDVCLLDDDQSSSDQQGSSSPSDPRKCLSDEHRNPKDFNAKKSSFKIPKKPSGSPDEKDKKDQQWFNSSFKEREEEWSGGCQTRSHNQKQRNIITYGGKRKSLDSQIRYRIHRQGHCTPKTRWKHANPPGTFSSLRNTNATSSTKEPCPSQVTNTHTSVKCNGSVSPYFRKSTEQGSCSSSLDKEKSENRSVLDEIMQGKSVKIPCNTDSDDSVPKSEDTDSDSNFRKKSKLTETPNSSKEILSDDNYDDCFDHNYCKKCVRKLSDNRKCPYCDNDIFPSQAATPRKPLSTDRFYSQTEDKQLKVQRKYNNRSRGNGVPKLVQPGSVEKMLDAKKTSNETSQTNLTIKKRKNQGKSNSEDSDSEQKPQVKKKRNARQTKLPIKVDVITLSDGEEEIEEATSELLVENSESAVKETTIIPESPINEDIVAKESAVEPSCSVGSEACSETATKQKTPPSKEEGNVKRESVQGYTRDDVEIEIMLGQDVQLGTLACTATNPLRIIGTSHNDEIKLDVDYDKKHCSLSISGKDLASFKVYADSNPGVIVLEVTPGYALKLNQRISNKGTFIKPGSAVAAERDIVLEVNEHIKPEVMADLMEWVTEKLSKSFAELSIKDVERIRSYKASSSTTNKQNQCTSSDEVSSTPMTTRSRTYNTRTNSNKQPAQAPQKLIVYPAPPQPGGITVTTEDIACLESGEFLNDVIIDFYLKFVFFEKLKPEDRARTHILSSFFYKRLTQRKKSNSDSSASTPDRMHSQVRNWTKNVDIFEKDFVIVPINESSHWYLAVICFAGHENPTYVNEINDDDDDEPDNKSEANDTETGTEEEPENGGDDDVDDDFQDFEFSPLAALRKKPITRNSRKSLSKQIIKSRPCILVFDSLGGSRARCLFNLRNYLKCEWRERKKEPATRVFDKDTIKGSHPKVPQQDNYCDCGVYVCQYMESFFEDPITDFSLPIRKPDWFSSVAQKRTDIRELIYTLKASAEIDGDT